MTTRVSHLGCYVRRWFTINDAGCEIENIELWTLEIVTQEGKIWP